MLFFREKIAPLRMLKPDREHALLAKFDGVRYTVPIHFYFPGFEPRIVKNSAKRGIPLFL